MVCKKHREIRGLYDEQRFVYLHNKKWHVAKVTPVSPMTTSGLLVTELDEYGYLNSDPGLPTSPSHPYIPSPPFPFKWHNGPSSSQPMGMKLLVRWQISGSAARNRRFYALYAIGFKCVMCFIRLITRKAPYETCSVS